MVESRTEQSEHDVRMSRYSRQILYEHIGAERQQRLFAARVTIIGCGALGSGLANLLARAGVGFMRIIDRDYIELNNLQRQTLFDEQDIADGLPKAEAAVRKIARFNSQVHAEAVVADVVPANVEPLIEGADLVLDGTDNLETRFLINDACVKSGRPWIYGACIGATGMAMPILPGVSPCLRCIWSEPPPPGTSETCDTAGILGPVVDMVASWQAIEAIKILTGQLDVVSRRLLQFDAWTGEVNWFDMSGARERGDCVCCGRREFEFLAGKLGSRSAVLCGRDAVQVSPPAGARVRFEDIAAKVSGAADGPPSFNRFMLRFRVGPHEVTLFADGRAIIKGTSSVDEARTIYARYVGV